MYTKTVRKPLGLRDKSKSYKKKIWAIVAGTQFIILFCWKYALFGTSSLIRYSFKNVLQNQGLGGLNSYHFFTLSINEFLVPLNHLNGVKQLLKE